MKQKFWKKIGGILKLVSKWDIENLPWLQSWWGTHNDSIERELIASWRSEWIISALYTSLGKCASAISMMHSIIHELSLFKKRIPLIAF